MKHTQPVMPDRACPVLDTGIRHPDANAQYKELDIADNSPLMKRILKSVSAEGGFHLFSLISEIDVICGL